MKAKYYNGVSKEGVYVDDRPIPGCLNYDERKAAYDELQKISDPGARKQRTKTLPNELGLDKKTTGNAKSIMNLHLGHGDIVIMHGADIQTYFEVSRIAFLFYANYVHAFYSMLSTTLANCVSPRRPDSSTSIR